MNQDNKSTLSILKIAHDCYNYQIPSTRSKQSDVQLKSRREKRNAKEKNALRIPRIELLTTNFSHLTQNDRKAKTTRTDYKLQPE